MLVSREERLIMRKDDNFATFIRTLGSSAGAKEGSVSHVVGSLRIHDYGPLTKDVNNLHRRLRLGETLRAWKYFAGETGSSLIHKFSSIFVEALRAGGKPMVVGEIVSMNFARVNTLRKYRWQSANTLKALLYGSMLGIAMSMYVTIELLDVLAGILGKYLGGVTTEVLPGTFSLGVINTDFLNFMVWNLILLHGGISAMIIKIVDGGDMYNALFHFVMMSWIGVFVIKLVPYAFKMLVLFT
jgi:flagellar protein FlaJ